jgi:hypothetical protein
MFIVVFYVVCLSFEMRAKYRSNAFFISKNNLINQFFCLEYLEVEVLKCGTMEEWEI